jgi:hypothetical protein
VSPQKLNTGTKEAILHPLAVAAVVLWTDWARSYSLTYKGRRRKFLLALQKASNPSVNIQNQEPGETSQAIYKAWR